MKDQTKKLITTAATVFVILSVCLFAGKNSSESARLNTDTDKTVVALTEEKEAVDGAVQRELSSAEIGESSEENPKTVTERETSKEETEKTEENTAMESESSGQNERTEETMPVSGKETPKETETTEQATSAISETTDRGAESTGSSTGSAEDNARADSTLKNPENETIPIDLSGDNWENDYYRCDEEGYDFIICNLSDPRWYANDEDIRRAYYNRIFALSDRYRKEHPFSEGSILKKVFPNIRSAYWFTVSFEDRYVVLEAYDTSGNKKFFLIQFTITDNYELDTVSIRELADDEIGK